MPLRDVAVRWELARDDRFKKVERQGVVAALPELAHSVHVDVRGLDPGREYFYRFSTGPDRSPVGPDGDRAEARREGEGADVRLRLLPGVAGRGLLGLPPHERAGPRPHQARAPRIPEASAG